MGESASAEFVEAIEGLALRLNEVPALRSEENCDVVREMMMQRGYALPNTAPRTTGFTYCYHVVKAAAGQPGALGQLATIIWRVDRSTAADRFQEEAQRLLPSEIFNLFDRFEFIGFIRDSVSFANLNQYYRLAIGEMLTRSLESAEDLVSELEEKIFPGQGHPLIRLTEAIARKTDRRATAKHARAWSERLAERIDRMDTAKQQAERKWLARFRERESPHANAATERVTLVQVIEPSVPRVDRFRCRVFMYHDEPEPITLHVNDTPQPLENVQQVTMKVLREVIERLRRPEGPVDVELEFFLPRRLLSYPIESWSINPNNTLGAHYVVVVRDLDRVQEPLFWSGWRRKWALFEEDRANTTSDAELRRWVTCSDAPLEPGVLRRELGADEYFSLGLTFPPLPDGQHFDLAEALDSGAPIVVWPRKRCDHTAGAEGVGGRCDGSLFKQDLRQRMAGRPLADLPRVVWEMRREQAPQNGSGIALLWDNPAHWPGLSEFRLDWPHPLEEE